MKAFHLNELIAGSEILNHLVAEDVTNGTNDYVVIKDANVTKRDVTVFLRESLIETDMTIIKAGAEHISEKIPHIEGLPDFAELLSLSAYHFAHHEFGLKMSNL